MIKKSNSKFVIERKYEDPNVSESRITEVSIIIKVNYDNKTFDIENSTGNKQFMFYTTPNKWREWLAVLECIKEAIEFDNKELGIRNNI